MDDFYREAPYGSFFKHPQLSKGTSVQRHMTPHDVFYNQQSDVRSQARVFVTSKVFLHFLYRTELLVSRLLVGYRNVYLHSERSNSHSLQNGGLFDNGTFFPPRTFQSVVDMNTMENICTVE